MATVLATIAIASGTSETDQPAQAAQAAQAAPAAIKDCTEPKGLGTNTAVVLTHGLFSKGDSWKSGGDASMYAKLKKMPGVYVETFDYEDTNTAWVTSDNIGPRLARRIACLAAHSRENKGLGKVVGVGHSMGGRAFEFAAAQTVNGRKTSEDLAQIVTIATPYQGSIGGDALKAVLYAMCHPVTPIGKAAWAADLVGIENGPCNNKNGYAAFGSLGKYSGEGKKLPNFPKNLPVLAIAGDVTLQSQLWKTPFDWHTNSDLIVGVGSAFDNETYKRQGVLVKCHEHVITRPDCWHSALTSNEQVKRAVVDTVSKYTRKTLTAGSLTLRVPQSWTKGKVMIDSPGNGLTGVRTSGKCYQSGYGSCEGFEIRGPGALHQGAGPVSFYNGSGYWSFSGGPDPCPGKYAGNPSYNGSKKIDSGNTTVGGKLATYTEWKVGCANPDAKNPSSYTQRIWWIPSHQVAIMDYNQTAGLWDVLKSASWSTGGTPFNEFSKDWYAADIGASFSAGEGLISWYEPDTNGTEGHIVDFTLVRQGGQTFAKAGNSDSGQNDAYGYVSFEEGQLYPISVTTSPGGVANAGLKLKQDGDDYILLCSNADPQGCGNM